MLLFKKMETTSHLDVKCCHTQHKTVENKSSSTSIFRNIYIFKDSFKYTNTGNTKMFKISLNFSNDK